MPDPDLAFRIADTLHDRFAGAYLYGDDGEPEFRLDAHDVAGLNAVDVTVYDCAMTTAVDTVRVRVEGFPS